MKEPYGGPDSRLPGLSRGLSSQTPGTVVTQTEAHLLYHTMITPGASGSHFLSSPFLAAGPICPCVPEQLGQPAQGRPATVLVVITIPVEAW